MMTMIINAGQCCWVHPSSTGRPYEGFGVLIIAEYVIIFMSATLTLWNAPDLEVDPF